MLMWRRGDGRGHGKGEVEVEGKMEVGLNETELMDGRRSWSVRACLWDEI